MILAVLGIVVGVIGGAFAQFATSFPAGLQVMLGILVVVLCPPSLIFVPLIDVEPGTPDFVVTWVMIALVNSALYALIGLGVGRLLWRSRDRAGHSGEWPAL
jgi:hypothetical protein